MSRYASDYFESIEVMQTAQGTQTITAETLDIVFEHVDFEYSDAGSMQKLSVNLTEMVSQYSNLAYKLEFINCCYDYIHQPPMHYTGTLPIEKRKDADYELEFRNVSFRYPGSDPYVLKDINLKFNVGQKLALVGRNGAGKTIIVKLLCRLYEPTEGEILLNGISIWKYDYAEYTRIFAPVFQDFKLFSLPVAENIASSTEYDES